MVFLVEREDRRVGLAGVRFHSYLCLAFAKKEELESTCLMRGLEEIVMDGMGGSDLSGAFMFSNNTMGRDKQHPHSNISVARVVSNSASLRQDTTSVASGYRRTDTADSAGLAPRQPRTIVTFG